MRALLWSVRLAVFLVLFAFAAKNTEPVVLKFFFGISWQVPLIMLLFGFLAVGVLLGMLGMMFPMWRQRSVLKKLQGAVAPTASAPVRAPNPDLVVRE
jgi:lipopolysaccharide assembly protein A